jgi:ATP citrate (pro-S)-lyase
MLVLLGEVGGTDEYDICAAMKDGRITKPLVAWCIGTCAKVCAAHMHPLEGLCASFLLLWPTKECVMHLQRPQIFPFEVQFGHAGALANSQAQTADAKNTCVVSLCRKRMLKRTPVRVDYPVVSHFRFPLATAR